MRAITTAESARRRETATARAHRRHQPPQPASRAFQLSFRARWQAWVRTDGEGEPVFERGMLQLDPEKLIPRADSDAYRITVRDAYLLAGHQLPLEVDGRTLMALRHQGKLDPAPRSPRRDGEDRELAELAHRTGEPVAILRRLPASYRHQWLAAERQADAARASAEMTAFRQQIADTFQPPPPMRLRSAFSAWRAAASRCPLERRDRRITAFSAASNCRAAVSKSLSTARASAPPEGP